jgi:signal transduction histidine kinase
MVVVTETPDGLAITIEDDGPGILERDFERVFQPFVRLEESRGRDTGGSGLGLTIARAVVLAHGGEIALANRPEGGLRVTITLPRLAQPEQQLAQVIAGDPVLPHGPTVHTASHSASA